MIDIIWQDILISIGSAIGVYTKAYTLKDPQTVMSRTATLPNAAAYIFTALIPFAALELWLTFAASLLSFAIWTGLYLFRAPEDEDWLGRVNTTYTEYTRRKIRNLYKTLTTK